jgi:hypothetical protein
MFSILSWVKSKLLHHPAPLSDRVTEFQMIAEGAWGGSFKEDDIPWAIVLDEVHQPEPHTAAQQGEASLELGLPAPVLFALSFLLALAVFCSVD